jgi:hypothetical protein
LCCKGRKLPCCLNSVVMICLIPVYCANPNPDAHEPYLYPQGRSSVPLFNPRTQVWSEHFGWSYNDRPPNRSAETFDELSRVAHDEASCPYANVTLSNDSAPANLTGTFRETAYLQSMSETGKYGKCRSSSIQPESLLLWHFRIPVANCHSAPRGCPRLFAPKSLFASRRPDSSLGTALAQNDRCNSSPSKLT